MIARTLRRLRGSALIASNLPSQRRVPFMPREAIEKRRDGAIRRIVAHAARCVPHYREMFLREGIDPRDIKGASDLDRLPTLDKEVIRAQPERFLAGGPAGRGALSVLSSGSTGTPMRLLQDRRAVILNLPYGEREREPVIRLCGGSFRPKEVYVGNESAVIKQVTEFYNKNTMMPVRPRRRYVSVREPVEKIAAILNEERPDLLTGYGGWIALFFKTISARHIEVHRPKLVMYVGEALPHGARDHIEGVLGIPVVSRYCSAEAFKIGFICERRTGFHLHEDICHVRIVSPEGENLPPGEPGEIVISNLLNRAMVFLNYRIGDVGALCEGSCACGRSFKRLSELEGRVEDILHLPGGRFVHPRAFWEALKPDDRILQYRVVQTEPMRFAVQLMTVDETAFHQALETALPRLRSLLGRDAIIEATHQTEYDRRSGQKFRAVSSLCGPKNASDGHPSAAEGPHACA